MHYQLIKKESLYSGFFALNKYHIKNQLFKGGWSEVYTREIFERGHAAAVLLFDSDKGRLILIEQFRPGAMETGNSPWLLELVAGMIEEGEKPEDVVKRESVEESGCVIMKLKKISEYFVSPGGTTEKVWLYLGKFDSSHASEYAGLESENEDIKVHCVSTEQAFKWLKEGKLNNAMTIIALQWLKIELSNNQSVWS